MIYKSLKDKQDKIVADFDSFKKKCTDESSILNDEYLEEIELCMVDVEDFLATKRIEEFRHYDPRLVFYRYEVTGKDIQKFIDLNNKLDEYIGSEAYYFSVDVNGKNYHNIPNVNNVNDFTPLTLRYFFDKLTKRFIGKIPRPDDGQYR